MFFNASKFLKNFLHRYNNEYFWSKDSKIFLNICQKSAVFLRNKVFAWIMSSYFQNVYYLRFEVDLLVNRNRMHLVIDWFLLVQILEILKEEMMNHSTMLSLCFLLRVKYQSCRCGIPNLENHRRDFFSNNWILYG